MKPYALTVLCMLYLGFAAFAQHHQQTYCNPVNLDYGYCPIPDFTQWGKHRTTADPVIVRYQNDYYLFSTNQQGYWWSHDVYHWHFIARSFLSEEQKQRTYDDLCAPAVWVMGDTMLVFGSTYTNDFPIWMSTDPQHNRWRKAVDSFKIGGWDPDFFLDDDGRLYMYNGSSNAYPIYGVEINRHRFEPETARKELLLLQPWRYGWQRFGEYNDNIFLDPFIEGAWMTKYHGKYYLQFAAPGTEFSGYADGVAVGDSPLGPFRFQSDPLSYKPGGFARGAGHGSTFQDQHGRWWHVSTIRISVKNNFERRIGIWPAGFDEEGIMYCQTAFGDYPYYLPDAGNRAGTFTGWMLLNYAKPVQVSSTYGSHVANFAVDEDIRTYWSAATADAGEWIISDLGDVSTVRAIQINYADQDAAFMGKQQNIYHQYQLFDSKDGLHWHLLVDKSHNLQDVPHDYVELDTPVEARYIKMVNLHMPTGKFALSGFRVFGNGHGTAPDSVQQFMVLRTEKDKRSAWIRWSPVDKAYAYQIYYGTDPHKLYNCIMVYADNQYFFEGMDREKTYYFTIEAINENGVSPRKTIMEVQ
ncbi:MAG: family 43 glycosylhydrolase [Thermoflavifilum sp.]|uniref:family 43 glycosylhydrolase n=1 Tax=Thermoflavifilum sp. TaxID=1968839 RepID=UPI0018A4B004|nr:family 43 glycosylhydrolase [Thermoflavifilum sp.]QOR76641.1 MAG: family 43 glycosylhydrolase [Thermoflavifilum sp.]